MAELKFGSEYFDAKDTLTCGQTFRFREVENGFKVFSADKACRIKTDGEYTYLYCADQDVEYFKHYFDIKRDYAGIFSSALSESEDILKKSAIVGKGIRILNQDKTETLFSFIISQNNNIPRIKGIIERLCTALGDKKEFEGETYCTFPTPEKMASVDVDFYKSIGLGYRAEYVYRLSKSICDGYNIQNLDSLSTVELNKQLLFIYGVGKKVADCVSLFGFHRSDAFPVDTWIEKVYVDDFNGTLKDRAKIAEWFVDRFKDNSGYFQQYLFHYKRIMEKSSKTE
ncbi:MAG: DNA-3-methyladenine glycosylase 2 family protein [Clostridiales bacterium]|nr:DNA-3-methyladenine glycosylase 2 family protein [Clostridiales bacterium]